LQYRGLNPDPGPWKLPRSVSLRPTASLGIADLPNQQAKRSKKRKFVFNIMVAGIFSFKAGESGLGKTTFLNSLFNTALYEDITPQNLYQAKTVEISPTHFGKDSLTLRIDRGRRSSPPHCN
jgi:septin family protein